jgi:hypothetical protein
MNPYRESLIPDASYFLNPLNGAPARIASRRSGGGERRDGRSLPVPASMAARPAFGAATGCAILLIIGSCGSSDPRRPWASMGKKIGCGRFVKGNKDYLAPRIALFGVTVAPAPQFGPSLLAA